MPLGIARADQCVKDLRRESRDFSTLKRYGWWGAGQSANNISELPQAPESGHVE